MASERTILLTQPVWGRNKGEKKERGKEGESFRERESTLSLDFLAIDPSNPGEARGKVDPHYKGYTWVPGLWSFNKFREVGVFSYLDISYLKIHENGLFWSCEAENCHAFRFQGSGTEGLMRGLSLDGPRLDMGLFCTVQNLFWTEIRPCVFSCMLLL